MIQGQSSHLYQEHLQQHYGQHHTHNIMDSINYKHTEEDNIVTKFETLNNSEEWEHLCYLCDYFSYKSRYRPFTTYCEQPTPT